MNYMADNKNIYTKYFVYTLLFALFIYGFYGAFVNFKFFTYRAEYSYHFIQIFSFLSFILYFIIGLQLDCYKNVLLILSFQVINLSIVYSYYTFWVGNSLGINPNDALFYQTLTEITSQTDFSNALKIIWNDKRIFHSIDDFGFPVIRWTIAKLFWYLSVEQTNLVLIYLNSLFHSIACYFFYKLARLFLNEKNSIICMLLWGFSTSIIFISASGLKDTIFSDITLICIFYMQKLLLRKKNIITYFNFFFFLILTLFFRMYITFFIIFVFLSATIFRKFFEKFFIIGIVSFIIFSYIGIDLVSFLSPKLGALKLARNIRLIKYFGSDSIVTNFINFALAWVSSIPTFSPKAEFRNLIAFTYSCIKFYFSFFFLFFFYKILKLKITKLYPILFLISLNVVLTIVSVVSLEYRFMLPIVYLYFIVILYGYEHIDQMFVIFNKRFSIGIANFVVLPITSLLFFYYNLR